MGYAPCVVAHDAWDLRGGPRPLTHAYLAARYRAALSEGRPSFIWRGRSRVFRFEETVDT